MKSAADIQMEIEDTLRLLDTDLDLLKRKFQPPAWVGMFRLPLILLFVAAVAAPLLPGLRRRKRGFSSWGIAKPRESLIRSFRNMRDVGKIKPTRFRDQMRLAWILAKIAARGKPGFYVVS